jgi:hypothetical protein
MFRGTSQTNFTMRESDCREFVANHSGNNEPVVDGGAVPTVAPSPAWNAAGAGLVCPETLDPDSEYLPPWAAHSVLRELCQRFSRLCVLMNPCPAGLEIHPDLTG